MGLCLRPRLGIKEGPARWEEADLGTMETQRDGTSLERWSLLLLLLGLVITPAASRALSYREAVLRIVDSLNQQSSEENLFRLLQLNSQPQGVSRGGGPWGGRLCSGQPAWLYSPSLCSCFAHVRKDFLPLSVVPLLLRGEPSQSFVSPSCSQHECFLP